MKKFVIESENLARDIGEYKAEFNGKILCEDEECRVPIFYIQGNIQPPHFRVLPPHKHSEDCNAKSKKKSDSRKKIINHIEGVPVLNL